MQITDWMPTFCSLAGYKPDRELKWDGANITDLLVDQSPLPDRPLYTAGPRWRATSLRHGDWKLVTHVTGGQKRIELFNIVVDPRESNNLADSDSNRVDAMLVKLEQAARADRDSVVKRVIMTVAQLPKVTPTLVISAVCVRDSGRL